MRMLIAAAATALLLTGCGTPDFGNLPPDLTYLTATPANVWYDRQWWQKDVSAVCFAHRGISTKDRLACAIPRWDGHCVEVLRPNDTAHVAELNAICNGWRPQVAQWSM